jgi:hypothetical protein
MGNKPEEQVYINLFPIPKGNTSSLGTLLDHQMDSLTITLESMNVATTC